MAKTETVYLQGKAKYARVSTPDPWGNFKVTLYLTPASYEKFKTLGLKNVVKKDEDGYFVVLRRPQQKMIRGKVVGFAPPTVIDAQGQPFHDHIGNGSDITVKLDYYGYKSPQGEPGKAIRLAGLKVDNLVPYVSEKDYEPDQLDAVTGLKEQPAQTTENW